MTSTKTLALVGAGPGLGLSIAKRSAQVALDLLIEPGDPEADPDALAARIFELYERRELPELKVGNYIAQAFAATTS